MLDSDRTTDLCFALKNIKHMSSDHSKFIEGYCNLYRQHFKEPYIFAGGKDGTAVKRLLGAGVSVDRAIDVAGQAFARSGYPWDMASSIAGFVGAWSIIVAALAKRPEPYKQAGPSKFDLRQQADAIKMMIARHPQNEESIYHDPSNPGEIPLHELRSRLNQLTKQICGF